MSKKIHGMVVLSGLSGFFYFVKIWICDALLHYLMMMHAKWMRHALTQVIRTIKTFTKYKKRYCR